VQNIVVVALSFSSALNKAYKLRKCQNWRNFWHKLSQMRHKNLFREHKLSRIKIKLKF